MQDESRPAGRAGGRRLSRRQVLLGGASAGGAIVTGGILGAGARGSSDTAPQTYHLQSLNEDEARLFGAMADRVFPADDTPGATQLGFIPYLDGQLAGAWGGGEGFYRHGPFHEPTSSGLGYQLPLVPRDLFKQVAVTIDRHATTAKGGTFASLSATDQDAVMTDLENGKVDLGYGSDPNGYTSASFFAGFLDVVNQALFADPMYGGNKDVGGWRWVGFPGDPMAYGDSYWAIFSQHHDPYVVPPKGLGTSGMGYGWGYGPSNEQTL